ncbi:hypothetical protein BDV11DRAFT_118648 [Aspergillus similis]
MVRGRRLPRAWSYGATVVQTRCSLVFFMLLPDPQIENPVISTQPMGCSYSNQAASGTLAAVRSSTTTVRRKTSFVKSLGRMAVTVQVSHTRLRTDGKRPNTKMGPLEWAGALFAEYRCDMAGLGGVDGDGGRRLVLRTRIHRVKERMRGIWGEDE